MRISFGLTLVLCAFPLLARAASAPPVELKSPGGNLVVTAGVADLAGVNGCPFYRVDYKGRAVLADSRLGLGLAGAPLDRGLEVVRTTRTEGDTTWKPVCGEREVVRDRYTQVVVEFKESAAPHRLLAVTFRAYDGGAAFCYTLPAQPAVQDFTVAAEATRFRFTGDHPAWAVYRAQGNYADGPTPLGQIKPGAERPLTVRVADDLYAAVTEARLVDFARMKLQPAAGEPHTLGVLLDGERGRAGAVAGSAPLTTPWRVVMVADSPGKLLEGNDIVLNLNDPCAVADTSWIKPGKVIRETTLTTAGGKACVDFCVARGLQYIEFDAGWYGPEGDAKSDATAVDPKKADRLDLHEVIRYGNERGVGVILYVNRRALERQIDELFPLYEKWGVKGVKFGFVDVGSRDATAWVYAGVRKAAAHRLMVDVHDEFRDTGYRRTYPNLMTVEGVFGNEEFPSPAHNAALPFTRFLTGPADYTFCWYSPKLKVTRAHQLALSTIYFSPWQFLFWYDKPAQYDGDAALDYWKFLPTTWDDTRVLHGNVGKVASVARRKGEEWYIGTIRAAGEGPIELPLAFLTPGRKYVAEIYTDPPPAGAGTKRVTVGRAAVDAATVLRADFPAHGGHAVRIVPAGGASGRPE